jgi:hypothetical protein
VVARCEVEDLEAHLRARLGDELSQLRFGLDAPRVVHRPAIVAWAYPARVKVPLLALVAALVVVGACSREKPAPPSPSPSPSPSAPSPQERHEPDAAPTGIGFTDASTEEAGVRTIALAGAPSLVLRTVGPALIEVTLADGAGDAGAWTKIEIERRRLDAASDASAPGIQHDSFVRAPRARSQRHLHAARQGTTYGYRARSSGAWSSEVMLRMPDPSAPPPAPSSLAARADTPFSAHVTWESGASTTAGFELQVKVNDVFVRAALVDPTEHQFVHHLRLPGQVLAYRVRSFNAQGASAPSSVATITMPSGATKPAVMGPCIPPVRQAPKSSGCDPEISTLDGGKGHVVSNVPGAGDGCVRHLVGEVAGCTRELGVFPLQADIVVVKDRSDEGWPLLHAIAGAGQLVGAQIQTLQFGHGRYIVVDEAHVCGEGEQDADKPTIGSVHDDLESCSPPFESCQRDATPL